MSYRLDAWETSLFAKRLHRQRRLDAEPADRKTGVYLGAYGYLENVKPAGANRQRIPDASLPKPLHVARDGAPNWTVAGFPQLQSGCFIALVKIVDQARLEYELVD